MSPATHIILRALNHTLITGEMVPMRELEAAVGVKERGMQSQDGEPGLLDVATDEILEELGWCLITSSGRGGGAKLTTDKEEVRRARERLASHVWHEKARVDRYDRMLEQLRRPQDPQMELRV